MRVLHVVPSLARTYGGPTTSLAGYCLAAAAVGLDTVVASPRPDGGDTAAIESSVPTTTFEFFPAFGAGSTVASPQLWFWLRAHAAAFDVIHVHGLFNPVSSWSARIATRAAPTVIRPFGTLSSYTFSHRRSWQKQVYFRLLDRPNIQRAAALHFTSNAEHQEAARFDAVRDARSFVIPPPVATRLANVAAEKRGATVLFLSRIHPVKRLPLLFRAWDHVVEAIPHARLLVAGDGEPAYVDAVRAHARTSGRPQSIEFLGFADAAKKGDLLARADAFVLPSAHENLGVAALEAAASGVAVIVTPEVALSSFIHEHRLGLVAEPTAEGIASAILTVLRETTLAERCRTTGARLVADHFSVDRIGADLLSMYQSIQDRV